VEVMSPRRVTWALPLGLLLAAGAGSVGAGCGQSVATCASVCAGQSSLCGTECAAEEAACSTAGYAADFQAYLTCVGNVGTSSGVGGNAALPLVPALCAPEAAAIESECGAGSGSGTGTSETNPIEPCAVLADCCAGLPPGPAAACNVVATDGIEAECTTALSGLEAECTGEGLGSGSSSAFSCDPPCESVGTECACP
jgi:hypothetical protein